MPSQAQSTSANPAAANKRRRIEAANATLRKPFRSPLVSRQQHAPGPGGEGSSPTAANRSTTAAPLPQPSPAPVRNGGFSGGVSVGRPCSPSGALKRRRVAGEPSSAAAPTRPGDAADAAGGGGEGGELLARLHTAQRRLANDLRVAEARLEIVCQARSIEESMGTARGGGGGGGGCGEGDGKGERGVDFGELVGRWKGASRLAAEELFGLIREKVEGMGGARAWRESRKRQREGFHPDGEEGEAGKKDDDHGEGEGEGGEDKAEDDDRVDDEEEESEELEFTMIMMLKSLNIDPEVLGYDAVEERWRD